MGKWESGMKKLFNIKYIELHKGLYCYEIKRAENSAIRFGIGLHGTYYIRLFSLLKYRNIWIPRKSVIQFTNEPNKLGRKLHELLLNLLTHQRMGCEPSLNLEIV